MPDPPHVGLYTRFILENPYPIAIGVGAVAAVMLWTGLREGRANSQRIGLAGLVASITLLIIASLVTTSGEHAEEIARSLVEATIETDAVKVVSHFTSEAKMSFASPTNPGYPIDYIEDQAARLEGQYKVESNRIRLLKGFTQTPDSAIVHMSCSTTIAGGYGATPSNWVLGIERQDDNSWKIVHITWVSLFNRPPPDM